jgi:hypothetical protein
MTNPKWADTRANRLRDRRDVFAFVALVADRSDPGAFVAFLDGCTIGDLDVIATMLAGWLRDELAHRWGCELGLGPEDAEQQVIGQMRAGSVNAAHELAIEEGQ